MKEYTIDRSKWVCGDREELGESEMLNEVGRMCCLGQICRQDGVALKHLYGSFTPIRVFERQFKLKRKVMPKFLIHKFSNSEFAEDMMEINDSTIYPQPKREKRLRERAAIEGIKLKFKGRLNDGPKVEL